MYNQKYLYCNDCGKFMFEFTTFRNCRKCGELVKKGTIFKKCQRCNKTKTPNIYGLCDSCKKIICELNKQAYSNR